MRAFAAMTVTLLLLGVLLPLTPVKGISPYQPPTEEDGERRLQYGLGLIMEDADAGDRFEVLVQFHDPVEDWTDGDLERRGFEVIRTLDLVNGVFMEGPKSSILALAEDDGVEFIEYNAPYVYHMNVTTKTIHANDVWERTVLRDGGIEETIDGTGVTVVVLDSGIDALHPDLTYDRRDIENGERPQEGDKVIFNAKKDQDIVGEPWIEFINTDTTSGHGTHCAGTVGGTGAASAGGKPGVAPNAWLIGLSMGEGFATIDEYAGLEWVFEHSQPGENPANIRVCTNSWGPGFPFDSLDPTSASVQLAERIVIENNVAVIFAAGNAGGDNHDGNENTVNPFVFDTAATIGVAATSRDGTGLASFTSRGDRDDETTWPDIGAPGVGIWSAAARITMIGAGIMATEIIADDQTDPYYLAISGTSMATPHVAGLAALLWQACPSMGMSSVMEEGYSDTGVAPDEYSESAGNPYIHETELILKLTSDYIDPSDDGDVAENGVPAYHEIGIDDRRYDYAQGYGMVNASKSVALALKLSAMRDPDNDGEAENDVTVFDAYEDFMDIYDEEMVSSPTDTIVASWKGEFVHPWEILENPSNGTPVEQRIPYALLFKKIYIPEEAVQLHITLEVEMYTLDDPNPASLHVTIDSDGDGEDDWAPDNEPLLIPDSEKDWYVNVASGVMMTDRGRQWSFNVSGWNTGIIPSIGNEFKVTVEIILDSSLDPMVERPGFAFGEPTAEYPGGTTSILVKYYDARTPEEDSDRVQDTIMDSVPVIVLLAVLGAAGYIYWTRFRTIEVPPEQ